MAGKREGGRGKEINFHRWVDGMQVVLNYTVVQGFKAHSPTDPVLKKDKFRVLLL